MKEHDFGAGVPRRSFLSRFGAAATAFGAAFAASPAQAQTPAPATAARPPKHAADDWLDQTAARHRMYFDTVTPGAFGQAIFFANNVYNASRNAYQLTDADTAVVIGVRHESTGFGYNDAMWAKYGSHLVERAGRFMDPKSNQPPTVNVYMTEGYGPQLRNLNVTLDSVIKRGLRLAVCQLATRANATLISQRTGTPVDDVYKELAANLVPNALLVPAGIIAINRAQERGYSFAYVD